VGLGLSASQSKVVRKSEGFGLFMGFVENKNPTLNQPTVSVILWNDVTGFITKLGAF